MKKKWKALLIVCGVVAGVGLSMCIAGVSMGATLSDVDVDIPFYERRTDDKKAEERNGKKFLEEFDSIERIKLDAGVLKIQLLSIPEKEQKIQIKGETILKEKGLELEKQGDTLFVKCKDKKNLKGLKGHSLDIYIPETKKLKEVEAKAGVGEIVADTIRAEKCSMSVGVGDVKVDYFETEQLELSCGTGDIKMKDGTIGESIKVKCGAGDIELGLDGTENDYDYELKTGMGDLEIEGMEKVEGIAGKRFIDNNADKLIRIDCGVGDVTVSF